MQHQPRITDYALQWLVAPAFAVRGTLWYRWLILVRGSLAIGAVGLQWPLLRAWNINLGIPSP